VFSRARSGGCGSEWSESRERDANLTWLCCSLFAGDSDNTSLIHISTCMYAPCSKGVIKHGLTKANTLPDSTVHETQREFCFA
jgi:hypothetical protein